MVKKAKVKVVKKAAKKTAKKGAKKVAATAGPSTNFATHELLGFEATATRAISRNEIYHRLEWYFDQRHNPQAGHSIDPNTPIESFFGGMNGATGRQVLWVNLNRMSSTFIPAWNSQLLHGVQLPWVSQAPIAIGIRDIRTFGNLIDSTVLSYRHAGWRVS